MHTPHIPHTYPTQIRITDASHLLVTEEVPLKSGGGAPIMSYNPVSLAQHVVDHSPALMKVYGEKAQEHRSTWRIEMGFDEQTPGSVEQASANFSRWRHCRVNGRSVRLRRCVSERRRYCAGPTWERCRHRGVQCVGGGAWATTKQVSMWLARDAYQPVAWRQRGDGSLS